VTYTGIDNNTTGTYGSITSALHLRPTLGAESNWPGNIGIIMYHHEGAARDWAVLALGVAVTAGAYVLARRFDHQIRERLKEA